MFICQNCVFTFFFYLENSEEKCNTRNPTTAFLKFTRETNVTAVQVFVTCRFITALDRYRFIDIDVIQ